MPFTLSHAVVALPFRRTVLIPSAIAIGAMVPDLPLFFPVFPVREAYWVTHGWWGIVTIDLAVAALVFVAWRVLLRPTVVALSPGWLRARFPERWDNANVVFAHSRNIDVALLASSLLLGSVTHVVWDLFTHPARAGAEWFPFLSQMWGPLAGYDWAQYASSALGLGILVFWAALTFRTRPVAARTSRMRCWLVITAWALAVVLPIVVTAIDVVRYAVPTSISGLVFRVGVPSMALEALLLLAVSITHFILEYRNSARPRAAVRKHVV